MKKFVSLLVVSIMILSLMVGCGKATVTPGDTTVKAAETAAAVTEPTEKKLSGKIIWSSNHGAELDTFNADAKAFMDANPGTVVEYEFIEKNETVATRLAAGDLPDICLIPNDLGILPQDYATHFAPIDGLGFTEDTMYFVDRGMADGKLYSTTALISFSAMIYSKKAFEKAGITAVPKTMDEFYAACDKLKTAGIIPYVTNYKDGWPMWAYLAGAFNVSMTGNANFYNEFAARDNFLNDEVLFGMNWLKDMVKRGYCEPDLMSTNWGACKTDLAEGRMGMTFLGSWFPPQANGGADIGMFPIPGSKGISSSGDHRFVISKNTKSLDLAKAYFVYLFGKDGKWYSSTGSTSAMKDAEYTAPWLKELQSFGAPYIQEKSDAPDYLEIRTISTIDFPKVIQEYLLTKNADEEKALVDKYNKMWADARSQYAAK